MTRPLRAGISKPLMRHSARRSTRAWRFWSYCKGKRSKLKAIAPSPDPNGGQPALNNQVATPEYVYLGRQPILDRSGALHAFELLFRSGTTNFARVTDDADATTQVIARLIGDMGLGAALGDYTGYVNVDRAVLMSDTVRLLTRRSFHAAMNCGAGVSGSRWTMFRRCPRVCLRFCRASISSRLTF